MSLCPEADLRASMDDQTFWWHVFNRDLPDEDYDPPDIYVPDSEFSLGQQCSECGAYGACAYDQEGRPMIHIQEDEDDR